MFYQIIYEIIYECMCFEGGVMCFADHFSTDFRLLDSSVAMLNLSTNAHGNTFPMHQIILFFDALQDYSIVKFNTWSAYYFILEFSPETADFVHVLTRIGCY